MREYIRPARPVRPTCVNIFALHAEKCPNRMFFRVPGEFSTGCGVGGSVPGEFFAELLRDGPQWADFFAELLRDGPQWANFFAEESLKALMVNVCMCARSPCGRLSSAGDTFRMQFPSSYFKI